MIIVLLGPPGAGKGTQAQKLVDELSIPQLSTGDMFRVAIENDTEVGKLAKSYMDAGNLVPDEVTIEIIRERIIKDDCRHGFILDGFPRNVAQAEVLDKLFEKSNLMLDKVLCFEVDDEAIVERQAGRLTAPKSKRVYHKVFNPPKVEGKCDETGEDLIQREDDKPEVVRHRLKVYHEQTAPVKSYYASKGTIVEIDASKSVEEVSTEVMSSLKQ